MIPSAASRVAVYYAPAVADPLSGLSAAWLGRDPERDVAVRQPDIPGIAEVTAEPRTYGFHATLKPPMRLRPGTDIATLMQAVTDLCAGIAPFDLPPLMVANVHGFLALRECEPSMMLQALADLCVAGLDRFRAAPDQAELSRRRRAGLAPAQEAMLLEWGYPYVFATWLFHMTLTRRLDADERGRYQVAAERYFAPALAVPRRV
ncbi:MAG: DUF1045 domain-containing protein, partial [Acetobacteraceae bacterium]